MADEITKLKVLENISRGVAVQLGGIKPSKPKTPKKAPSGKEWISLGNGIGWWEYY